jgi:hypothetical protein
VNTDRTARLATTARLAGVDNGNVLCTSALCVLDSRSARAARGGLLASRSIRHAIVELQLAIELNGDLELVDGKSRDARTSTTGEAGAAGGVRRCFTSDAFVLHLLETGRHHWIMTYLEGAASQHITLAGATERGSTREAIERESTVAAERAKTERAPVKSWDLVGAAVIVGIRRALKG